MGLGAELTTADAAEAVIAGRQLAYVHAHIEPALLVETRLHANGKTESSDAYRARRAAAADIAASLIEEFNALVDEAPADPRGTAAVRPTPAAVTRINSRPAQLEREDTAA